MKRKFLSILLTLAMALTLLPTAAMAEGEPAEVPAGEGSAPEYVAQIGDKQYATLQAAVDAAKNKTVKLIADTTENVTISTYGVTLDLNGFTLNGSTGKREPALTVSNARVTVQDSSAAQTGTIKRDDTAENSGISSHMSSTFREEVASCSLRAATSQMAVVPAAQKVRPSSASAMTSTKSSRR